MKKYKLEITCFNEALAIYRSSPIVDETEITDKQAVYALRKNLT
ncbi:MAG: hypothetical protein RIS64_1760 [Bacteroidota bacterium]|jgi:hypothetical protein